MEIQKLEYRMYGLVAYQLSDIQKGIQYGHSTVEYGLEKNFGKDLDYIKWSTIDKTFIILDGGSTNDNEGSIDYGSLQKNRDFLAKNEIKFSEFREPDLNNCLTAVVFLVDERVFKRYPLFIRDVYYPDFDVYLKETYQLNIFAHNSISIEDAHPKQYKEWLELIGGETNHQLRSWLPKFKLA